MTEPCVIILDMKQACMQFASDMKKDFFGSDAGIRAKISDVLEYAFYSHITALGMRHRIEIRRKVFGDEEIDPMLVRLYCHNLLSALAHKLASHNLEEITTHDYRFDRLEPNGLVVLRRKP